jgi:hypothetical protein|tara:strand:- start:117 stop:482 length:366 start_codon:yes stop_codon:yes gene_type:complete
MASLANSVLDGGLSTLTSNGTRIDICTTEPTTYAEATSTYTLGTSATTTGSPADRSAGGREVTVAAVTDASVTGTGVAAFYAITNGSNALYATGGLSTSQSVTTGNTFSLGSFTIGIPDPA